MSPGKSEAPIGAAGKSEVCAAIDREFPRHLAAVQALLRLKSISNEGIGMEETAATLANSIRTAGGTADIHETRGYPIVSGEIDAGKPRTVLVYGMYDVMPVAGEEWSVPPFDGRIIDVDPFGPCIVARGIFNSKGPLQGTLNVVSLLKKLGQLPVNVKFMIEGEEEMGSKHLPAFVQEYRDRLRADVALFPFYSENRAGTPILYLGCKGLLYLDFITKGGDRGGPRSRDVHSSFAAWISSPAWRLVNALATLVDADESILLSEFSHAAIGPQSSDVALIEDLAKRFDASLWLAEADAAKFKGRSADPRELLRQYLFSPTITINGLQSGHQGPGMKTVLPYRAGAKVDIRLVPGMNVETTLAKVREHLNRHGFEDVDLSVLGSYAPAKLPLNHPSVQALIESYRLLGRDPEIWPTLGGSAPFYLFTEYLQMPVLMAGLGHGGRAHSANEYAPIEGMKRFEYSIAKFLQLFAKY